MSKVQGVQSAKHKPIRQNNYKKTTTVLNKTQQQFKETYPPPKKKKLLYHKNTKHNNKKNNFWKVLSGERPLPVSWHNPTVAYAQYSADFLLN